jgi:hypothetical protein
MRASAKGTGSPAMSSTRLSPSAISGMNFCTIAVRAPCWPTVSTITLRFASSARTRKIDVPPMPSSGFNMVSRCASMKASIRVASRVTSVGAMKLRERHDRELLVVVADRARAD